jgi:hypothetical protein
MKEEEMQEAPKDWIPKDDKLKIEGEEWAYQKRHKKYKKN